MARKYLTSILTAVTALGLFTACQPDNEQPAAKPPGPSRNAALQTPPKPPTPPLFENFEGEPQLSLFPRVGDYRPENDDSERLPYWGTFIEHVLKTSGVAKGVRDGAPSRAFGFRSINTLDSIAFFTPLAVEPQTVYQVSFRLKADLPEGAMAGIGVLEFDEFLWVGEQYSESLALKHQTGVQEGVRISGKIDWEPTVFSFTTGPATRMIHLVFFREGKHDRLPVLWDDIAIEKAAP